MSKYLLIVSALFIGFWLWRSGRSYGAKNNGAKNPNAASPKNHPQPVLQDMVRCSVCGVHQPQTDALKDGDDWYCSAEHRQLRSR